MEERLEKSCSRVSEIKLKLFELTENRCHWQSQVQVRTQRTEFALKTSDWPYMKCHKINFTIFAETTYF